MPPRSIVGMAVTAILIAACAGSEGRYWAPRFVRPSPTLAEAPAFTAGQSIEIVDSPANVFAADLDGDGALDLAAGSETTDGMAILLGNGDGTFGAPSILHVAPSDYLIATDVSGDEVPDLVSAGDRSVSVMVGKGDGTFRDPSIADVVGDLEYGEAFWVDAADLDGDGSRDIVASVYGDDAPNPNAPGHVVVLFNAGDGTFADPVFYADQAAVAVAIGDFDHDGANDVATANFDATVRVFRGKGNGSLDAPSQYPITGRGAAMVAADFNGDRMTDLLTGNDASQSISVLIAGDGGSFGPATNFRAGNTHSVQAADLDGDGNLDLLAGGYTEAIVRFWPGAGDGTFAETSNIPLGHVLNRALDTGDFNGDAKLDLVVNDGSTGLHIFLAE